MGDEDDVVVVSCFEGVGLLVAVSSSSCCLGWLAACRCRSSFLVDVHGVLDLLPVAGASMVRPQAW